MKIPIIAIGNSRGVRLPKAILDQVGFGADAELSVEKGQVVLRPAKAARSGWARAFLEVPDLAEEDKDWLEAPLDDDDS